MITLHQKKLRWVNYETSKRKADSSSRIYLTSSKVAQYRLVDDNMREKLGAKSKQQRRQPPKSSIFNRSDLKFFRNSKTPWRVYHNLPPKNTCSSTSLNSIQTQPRMPLYHLPRITNMVKETRIWIKLASIKLAIL